MRKFRELTNVQKAAVVGTGIAVPVVGLGVANFAATRKAKVNALNAIFNTSDTTNIDSISIGKMLDTKMSVLSEQTEIRHILFELCTELTALYPSRLLCTAGRVNAVPELLEMITMANEILKLCYDNTSDSLLHDIGDNVIEIMEDIFHDDDYLNSEVLKSNIKQMENILDEIELIVMEEADDFFEDEEAAEPEAKKASGNTDVENKSSSNCFDVFKSSTVKDTTVPSKQNEEESKEEESAPVEEKESHSEEVARKNAITDEEAFEQAKKIYINMPEKFKTEKLNKKYGVESSAEKKSGDETVETTEAKKEEAKAIASEIAETVVDAAEKTLELDNSNQKYPAKKVTKTQSKAPAEKKPVKRKTSTTKKEEVTVNEQK